jgi:hypothetical protein
MTILTNSGRAAIAEIIRAAPVHMAWGSGDAAWDVTAVPESLSALALVAEVGRRAAAQVLYCTPDSNGDIVVPNGTFAISGEPTRYLYCKFLFDYVDGAGATIRELGVFLNTTIKPTVPGTKTYFSPADILSPGKLLLLERIAKLQRSDTVRQQFEYVVQL